MKSMNSLFIMDRIDSIDLNGDSTFILMCEYTRRGWTVYSCLPNDLYFEGGTVLARALKVECGEEPRRIDKLGTELLDTAHLDVVWMRKDPPFDIEYIFTTLMLDIVSRRTPVINNPEALRFANEKMYALRWPHLVPETVVSSNIAHIRRTVERMGQAVLKPWDGNAGRGVIVTRAGDLNVGVFAELLTGEESRSIIIQRYVPEIFQGDKRVILVDGEPLGWLNRIPGTEDHRGNMHVGASVVPCDLSERDLYICRELSVELKKSGLLFVGIDIIGSYLTEINVTSPTGIQEINRLMGKRLERDLVDAAEEYMQRWNEEPK